MRVQTDSDRKERASVYVTPLVLKCLTFECDQRAKYWFISFEIQYTGISNTGLVSASVGDFKQTFQAE